MQNKCIYIFCFVCMYIIRTRVHPKPALSVGNNLSARGTMTSDIFAHNSLIMPKALSVDLYQFDDVMYFPGQVCTMLN